MLDRALDAAMSLGWWWALVPVALGYLGKDALKYFLPMVWKRLTPRWLLTKSLPPPPKAVVAEAGHGVLHGDMLSVEVDSGDKYLRLPHAAGRSREDLGAIQPSHVVAVFVRNLGNSAESVQRMIFYATMPNGRGVKFWPTLNPDADGLPTRLKSKAEALLVAADPELLMDFLMYDEKQQRVCLEIEIELASGEVIKVEHFSFSRNRSDAVIERLIAEGRVEKTLITMPKMEE